MHKLVNSGLMIITLQDRFSQALRMSNCKNRTISIRPTCKWTRRSNAYKLTMSAKIQSPDKVAFSARMSKTCLMEGEGDNTRQ